MCARIVENEIDLTPIVISTAQVLEKCQDFSRTLPLFAMHPQMVFVDIVGSQIISDTVSACIGCSVSDWIVLWCPYTTRLWSDFNRSKNVEADDGGPYRRLLVERFDAFFLASYSGSDDRFHVRVR